MAYGDPAVVVASAARTTTGNSAALPCETGEWLSLLVETTALSGTPSLVLSVEWSMDGVAFAAVDTTADAFVAITTQPVQRVKLFAVKAPFYRVVWTITGGTPSITFQVSRYTTT